MVVREEALIKVSDDDPDDVVGDMATPHITSMDVFDEPIRDTILRDLKAVCVKFRYVLQPSRDESKLLLKEWDLWGPLLLCTLMAVVLQGSSSGRDSNDGGPEFAEVFVIVWVGSLVVTLNSKLLGGNVSVFQSVCVLGYCLVAPAAALVICRILLLLGRSTILFVIRLLIALSAFAWSTRSCMVFLAVGQVKGREALAGYPVCLFYAVICWLVASHTD